MPPAALPDPIWYFAYGSNVNEHAAPEGRPGEAYLNLIREAARQRGLPAEYIAFLDRVEARD
jgi:soluble lytic murein transglycosylase-like protein